MPAHPLSTRSPGLPLTAAVLSAALLAMLSGCVVAPHQAYRGPAAGAALARSAPPPMFFYPAQGQPDAQQDRDRYACYQWASRESGQDPGLSARARGAYPASTAMPPAPAPAPGPQHGEAASVAAGAAIGATMGAVVSSRRHVAENAVLGAILGAAVGAASHQAQRAAAPPQATPAPLPADGGWSQDPFRRAMATCMQGRGYRVG